MAQQLFSIQSSQEIITPTKGSLFFKISSPQSFKAQPIGWGLVELVWQSPTLIEPFLQDLKALITNSVITLNAINPETILKLTTQIQERFIDWQVNLCFIFHLAPGQLSIFTTPGTKSYVLKKQTIIQIPQRSSLTHFLFAPTKKHHLLITTQQIPPNLAIVDINEFINTIKKTNHPFILITPTRKAHKTLSSLLSFKPQLPRRLKIIIPILFVLLAAGFFVTWTKSSQTASPIIVQQKNPQYQEILLLINKLQQQIDKDPLESLRLMSQIQSKLDTYQIADPAINQAVQRLSQKLAAVNKQPSTKLVYKNQPLAPKKTILIRNKLFFFTPNQIFSVEAQPNSIPQPIVSLQDQAIIDIATDKMSLFFLTAKGVFWLKDANQIIQIAQPPKNQTPRLIAFYLSNLYLLTQSGQVFKLSNWPENYPTAPRFYFANPLLSQAKQMIVSKKFYILTKNGRLYSFYFGNLQTIDLDPKIAPITTLFFDSSLKQFAFVNSSGYGIFDLSGKLISWKKTSNPYQEILVDSKYFILRAQRSLYYFPHEE
ncbi:MAG: hypothetical protein GXP43_02125 [bacterium]|nr:hypothetical protein [bacterium]